MALRYLPTGTFPDLYTTVRGALVEILGSTGTEGTIAVADDAPGSRLEASGGFWFGDCGSLTSGQNTALLASGVCASLSPNNARATVNGSPVTWRGAGVGWAGENPTRLSRRVRLGTFGDSTATYWVGNDNATMDLSDTEAFSPSISVPGAALWMSPIVASLLYRLPCHYVACGGISGSTTSNMLSRSAATKTNTRRGIQDVISMAPDVVKLSCGSINDLVSFDVNTSDATIYAVADRHRAIVMQFVSAGVTIYDVGILGFSQALANITYIQRALVMINARLEAFSSSVPGWMFIRTVGIVSDASGAYLPGMSTDGVHLNATGARVLAEREVSVVNDLFMPSFDGDVLNDGVADFLNPTAGKPRNTDQWNDDVTNATVATADGVTTITANVVGGVSKIAFKYKFAHALASLVIGDAFYTHATVVANVDGVESAFQINTDCVVYNGATYQIGAAENPLDIMGKSSICSHPIKLNFAGSSAGAGSEFRISMVPRSTGLATIKIYPVFVRKQ